MKIEIKFMMKEAGQLNQQEYFFGSQKTENFEGIKKKLREYYLKLKEEAGKNDADSFVLAMIKEIEEAEVLPEQIDVKGGEKPDKKIIDLRDKKKEIASLGIDEVKKRIEEDRFKSNFIKKLEENGVIEYKDGHIVVDFEKIVKREFYHFTLGKRKGKSVRGSQKMLCDILKDVKIISKKDLAKGNIVFTRIEDGIEASSHRKKRTIEDARKKLLEELEKDGIYEEIDGIKIFDIDKFKEKKYGGKYFATVDGRQVHTTRVGIFNLLREETKTVISKKEYKEAREKHEELKLKPLFNVPESADEAFDIDKIRNKEYYLNIWDIGSGEKSSMHWNKAIEAENGDRIMINELAIATKIYKDYKGKRKNGELLIYDKEAGLYKKINDDWLRKERVAHDPRRGIHKYILEKCSNLQERGLFTIDDFSRINTVGISGKLMRRKFFAKGDKLEAPIDSVRYYIGRKNFIFGKEKIPIKNIKVVVLDDRTAGIVTMHDGREELRYTIDLLSKEEKEEKRQEIIKNSDKELSESQISALTYLTKKDLKERIKPYSNTSVITRKESESDADYEKRRSKIVDYSYIEKVTDKFVKDCGVGIHNLSWREQEWLAAAVYDFGIKGKYDKLVKFVNKQGANGLKAFLSLESGQFSGDDIILLGESLKDDPKLVNKLFEAYASLVDQTDISKKQLREMFKSEKEVKDDEVRQISRMILNKANALLLNYVNLIKEGKEIDKDELLNELEGYKADAVTFASIFKTAYEKEKISFDELRGVDYKTVLSKDLSETEKDMIRRVVKNNYPRRDQQQDILEKIDESFNDKKTKWHLLIRGEDKERSLVSCVRFDDIDDNNVYAATFNVGIAYRGSSLGNAMFDRVMADEAKEKKIHAIAEIGKEVTDFYINKGGFNVKEVQTNKKTGIKYYGIERFDPENEFYGTKKLESDKELMVYYRPEAKIEDLIIAENYILIKKEEDNIDKIYSEVNKILSSGYVMTRTIRGKENYLVFEKMAVKDLKKAA